MDNAAFERWSQTLEAIRKSRQAEIEERLTSKADAFKPAEFYQLAHQSLDRVFEQWFEIEQEGWANPPANIGKALQAVRSEMESISEFELEAVERDAENIMSRITWDPDELEEARKSFLALAEDMAKKYQLRLKTLSPGELKIPAGLTAESPRSPVQYSAPTFQGGSGVISIVMLIIGLLLGSGLSLYFKDSQKKIQMRLQEEKSKLVADQRALSDSMALLHASFADLVMGKSQNIPQLQAEVARIQHLLDERTKMINEETAREREYIIRRTPAGNRLDQALDELEKERLRRIKKYEDEYNPGIKVFQKRILLYKDLLGDSSS